MREAPVKPEVQSSAIQRIEYDPVSLTLFVIFLDGDAYAYLNVPAEVHDDFMRAPSKGRFFSEAVRDRYETRRLDVSLSARDSSADRGQA
jgi:hypothetical protein